MQGAARASGRFVALLWLAAAIDAHVVVAQPAPSANPIGVELRYDSFAGCPEREAFAKNLDARRRGLVVAASATQLDVRLHRLAADGSVEGSIVVSSADGVRSARRIVASTCGEAADALALIAALALQGIEVEEVPADDTDARAPGRRKEASDNRGGRRADRPRASAPASTNETEPTTTTPTAAEALAETKTAVESETESETESAGEALESEEQADDDPEAPDAERSMRAYVQLAGGVASGVLPRVQPVPELSLGLSQGPPGVLFWSVHAAFRISPDQTRHFDQGVITLSWWTGLSAVCLGARVVRLSASGCATLEAGVLSGGADDTENPQHERRAWVAVGPGATLGYDLTPALRLQLRAEVLTPLTRYSLELPRGTAVHEPAALGLRAGLGLALYLE
jgi:hypothetical protein